MLLNAKNHERARQYLMRSARPLDRALFLHEHEGGPAAAVLEALASYQNADGGFGHGIECDLRAPGSTPIATSVGFQVLRAAGATAADAPVRAGIRYLLDSYDPARPGWIDVTPDVNDHPHAPWWHHVPGRGLGPETVWGNPDAELVGVLHAYAERVPPAFLEEVTALALERLDAIPYPVPSYVVLCYLRMARSVPAAAGARVLARLREDAGRVAASGSRAWTQHAVEPFWLAPRPDAPLADALRGQVAANLDALIARQDEDGSWAPTWSWSDPDPSVWAQAEREIRGELTRKALSALCAYGRVEGR